MEQDTDREMKLSKALMDLLNGMLCGLSGLIGSIEQALSKSKDNVCGKRYHGAGRDVQLSNLAESTRQSRVPSPYPRSPLPRRLTSQKTTS